MEATSLVQQWHNSPELVRIGVYIISALGGGYVVLWGLIVSHINRKFRCISQEFDKKEGRIDGLRQGLNNLELETKTNYVSYSVFNALMREYKEDMHSGMKEIREELKDLRIYLQKSNTK